MKTLYHLLCILSIFLIFSCNQPKVQPAKIEILGPLGEYLEILDQDYAINEDSPWLSLHESTQSSYLFNAI